VEIDVSFDSLTLCSVTTQLNETVVTGKILSVIQSSPHEFTLRIAAHQDQGEHIGSPLHNLLFSIHPVYARVHLTAVCPKREKRWHFADFLQKHTGDGKIAAIEQINFDRVLKIRIIPQGDIIDPAPKVLIGEFMGKHSNVILVEEGTNRILESMKHIDETMSRYRQILPGLAYVMPPMSQSLDPFSTNEETFSAVLASSDGPLWEKLLRNFRGMSPLLAKEIMARAPDSSLEAVRNTFVSLMADIQDRKFCPTVITRDSNSLLSPLTKGESKKDVPFSNEEQQDVLAVSAISLQQFHNKNSINFPTISDALEFFYRHLIMKESLLAEKAAILQAAGKRYEALQQKHRTLDQQLKAAENADDLKLKGELLIANLHEIERGQKEVSLRNFYDPHGAKITIQLDERLRPSENAQRYFEDYKKAKRSRDILATLVSKNQAALESLEKAIKETENARDLSVLATIRDDLVRKDVIREKSTRTRKPGKKAAPLFRRFKSSDGFQIYVGRNDKENELLIKSEAGKNDMWLHAKQIEGSYVIVRNPEKKPDIPRRTLLEAAIIAAYFSKAKHSGTVPVDYTWVKYVTKPRGAKPGFVIYTHEKTLFVSPPDFDKLPLAQ
jgi:predicted ribosome quality control (RQC) complex YloA/Tae2 family protein